MCVNFGAISDPEVRSTYINTFSTSVAYVILETLFTGGCVIWIMLVGSVGKNRFSYFRSMDSIWFSSHRKLYACPYLLYHKESIENF
jgi:hypothetical protein